MNSSENMLSVSEVALIINLHPRTVRRWCKDGTLPAIRGGKRGKYMIKESDLELLNYEPPKQSEE